MCRLTLVAPLGKKPDLRLTAVLAANFVKLNSSETGQDDGSGLCFVNQQTTAFHKSKEPGYNFVITDEWSDSFENQLKEGKIDELTTWLGHVRQASPGIKVTLENSHPFIEDSITGMHNGVIRNKTDFAKDVESDSEAFFKYLAQETNWGELTYEVLKAALEKIRGAFCMLINDRNNTVDPAGIWIVVGKARELHIQRNENFVVINTTKGGFAAIDDLRQTLKSLGDKRYKLLEFSKPVMKLKEETIYFLSKGKLEEVGSAKETDYQTTATSTGFVHGYGNFKTQNAAASTSKDCRNAAKLYAQALEILELTAMGDYYQLARAFKKDKNELKAWTAWTVSELEDLVEFSNFLKEGKHLEGLEKKAELWMNIISIARAKLELTIAENPYEFLSNLGTEIQFPYWLNTEDFLYAIYYDFLERKVIADDKHPTI